MEAKEQEDPGKCNICHNKEIKPGQEGVYIGDYLGNKSDRLHVCHGCYQGKKQKYLKNYAFIYSYEPDFRNKDTGYIKIENGNC
jgi:hypothetical protein